MKNFRNIALSILITATLLIAPASIAQPHTPSLPGFDLVEFISDLFSDMTSIFASTEGAGDSPDVTQESGDPTEAEGTEVGTPMADDASPSYDPFG